MDIPPRYPVEAPEEWLAFGRLSFSDRIRLIRRDRRYIRRFRRYMPDAADIRLESIRRLPHPPEAREPVLICVARNSETMLPSLLEHYRRLGLNRFAFVDDQSTDRTREILLEAPDVDLYRSNVGFRESAGGLVWRDLLLKEYGRRRWYVSIDADEYLVFPGCESRSLISFIGDLSRAGQTRAAATMLDLYPEGPLSDAPAHVPPQAPPSDFSPLFDSDAYGIGEEEFCIGIYGGPRSRLFGAETLLTKFPLIYADWFTRISEGTNHGILPLGRNFVPVRCVLLHHKFPAGAVGQFRIAAEEGAHWHGAIRYKTAIASAAFGEHADLNYPGSVRYRDSEQLVAGGYMQDLRASQPGPALALPR